MMSSHSSRRDATSPKQMIKKKDEENIDGQAQQQQQAKSSSEFSSAPKCSSNSSIPIHPNLQSPSSSSSSSSSTTTTTTLKSSAPHQVPHFSEETIQHFLDRLDSNHLLDLYSNLCQSPLFGQKSTTEEQILRLLQERVNAIVNSVWELPKEESIQVGPYHWLTEFSYDKYMNDVRHLADIYRSLLGSYSNIEEAAIEYRNMANRSFSSSFGKNNLFTNSLASSGSDERPKLSTTIASPFHLSHCPHHQQQQQQHCSSSATIPTVSPTVVVVPPATVIKTTSSTSNKLNNSQTFGSFYVYNINSLLCNSSSDSTISPCAISYSRKVFAGGFPTNATIQQVVEAFGIFGSLQILLPPSCKGNVINKGFCYLIYDDADYVQHLIYSCERTIRHGEGVAGSSSRGYYRRFEGKQVQIIPWKRSDTKYNPSIDNNTMNSSSTSSQTQNKIKSTIHNELTVFVGALHGTITASILFTMMNDLFHNVVYTALDTDHYHYPVGSGRVTFNSLTSYRHAVKCNLITVRASNFEKTIQIDPYLEDSMCRICHISPGIYFCRSEECLNYFCPPCWQICHVNKEEALHTPIRRTFNFLRTS